MVKEKFGIESIKSVMLFSIVMGMRLEKITAKDSAKGSKVTWTEALGSLPALKTAPEAIRAVPQLKQEFLDLSEEERKELEEYLRENVDLKNKKVENIIEKGWVWLDSTYALVEAIAEKEEDTDQD